MSKETASKQHFRNLYRFVSVCLQLADMADEKQESPLNMGYRVFSGYMRGGAKEIIDLQNDYYGMVFKAECAQRDADDARNFLQECFGDREIDSINEDDRKRILFLCDKIRREWEANGAEQ